MIVRCPSCGASEPIPKEHAGMVRECGNCGRPYFPQKPASDDHPVLSFLVGFLFFLLGVLVMAIVDKKSVKMSLWGALTSLIFSVVLGIILFVNVNQTISDTTNSFAATPLAEEVRPTRDFSHYSSPVLAPPQPSDSPTVHTSQPGGASDFGNFVPHTARQKEPRIDEPPEEAVSYAISLEQEKRAEEARIERERKAAAEQAEREAMEAHERAMRAAKEAKADKERFASVWKSISPANKQAPKEEQRISRLMRGMRNPTLARIYEKYMDEDCGALADEFENALSSAGRPKNDDFGDFGSYSREESPAEKIARLEKEVEELNQEKRRLSASRRNLERASPRETEIFYAVRDMQHEISKLKVEKRRNEKAQKKATAEARAEAEKAYRHRFLSELYSAIEAVIQNGERQ